MAAEALNRLNPVAGPDADIGIYRGDLPDEIHRRYFTKTKFGAPFAFYKDAVTREAAFRDHGGRLSTERNDPHVVRDLLSIARHRNWAVIAVRGQTDFRREVWIQARVAGLEVRGYHPTERDRQDLDRRLARAGEKAPRTWADDPGRQCAGLDGETRMKVVEAVVRHRLVEHPAIQARILAAARDRIAGWLERGAPLAPHRHGMERPRADRQR